MKQLKNYLHLYIGCDVMVTGAESASYKCQLTGVMSKRTDGENILRIQVFEADGENGYEGHGIKWLDEDEIELILRPLSDMTKEESLCWQKFGGSWAVTNQKHAIERFIGGHYAEGNGMDVVGLIHHLISSGFDIFGLIEARLAVDLVTTKSNKE